MFEYEMTVNITVENKEAIENLLITIESLNTEKLDISAVELLSISSSTLTNDAQKVIVENYENDSWLSPLKIKELGSA